jgi:ATP-binding cassette subfamily B protein/subfamily B ATP-binding cassette protein MsbA
VSLSRRLKDAWRKYGRLARYAAADRRGWAYLIGVTLLGGAFGLLQPWPMKVVVDHVLGGTPAPEVLQLLPGASSPRGLLAWMVLATLAVFAVNSALDVALTRAWITVGQGMVYRLAGDLFAHIQRRSLIFHSQNSVGDSMGRITADSWCAYKVIDALLYAPAHALVMLAVMVFVLAQLDAGLTLLALAAAPVMTVASYLLGRRVRAAAHRQRESETRLQSHVQRTLRGVQVVQSFAQEERERRRFEECAEEALRATRKSTLASSRYGLASGLVGTLGTGLVLFVASRRVLSGEVSVGSLLVFLSYLTALQAQMKAFTGLYGTLQELGAGVDRVTEVLDADLELKDGPEELAAANGEVRLEGVWFGYEPDSPVLRGVDLTVPAGSTVALVGHTGAGKTTLAGLVARSFDPWQGRVLLDGRDLRSLRLADLRRQVAVVLQEPFLFPLSVAENVAYGRPGASRKEIEEAAAAANADAFIRKLPSGYETVVGERGATLSGGERQRLSIARALLKDAPVLILDEPTSALDAETERLVMQALRNLMANRTTFLIAHRLTTVRHADLIVCLDGGRVVESGSHDELLARGGFYARLYQTQTGQRAAG